MSNEADSDVDAIADVWEGWHFVEKTRRLRYGDARFVKAGRTYIYNGTVPIEMCVHGLHASRRAIDALGYAAGPVICRVRLSGSVIDGDDKSVATKRKVLWTLDATQVLHEFACWCAEAALLGEITQGRAVDPFSWAAVSTKRKWLRKKATTEELFAAESAARSAAESAARSAAESAARSAARSAAWSAAESAAWSAAWSAAESAAESAAWSAAESAANIYLQSLLFSAHANKHRQ